VSVAAIDPDQFKGFYVEKSKGNLGADKLLRNDIWGVGT
jgi:hypothetical protein